MRTERDREAAQTHARNMYEAAGSTVLRIRGHLFDTNLINSILDLLEENKASFYVVELDVRKDFRLRKVQVQAYLRKRGRQHLQHDGQLAAQLGK